MNFQHVEDQKIEYAAEVFKGFGNPIRIRIIDALQGEKLRVMELSTLLDCPQPIVSQQLKILKSAGIVQRVRESGNYCYELSNRHFADMIKCMRGCLGL